MTEQLLFCGLLLPGSFHATPFTSIFFYPSVSIIQLVHIYQFDTCDWLLLRWWHYQLIRCLLSIDFVDEETQSWLREASTRKRNSYGRINDIILCCNSENSACTMTALFFYKCNNIKLYQENNIIYIWYTNYHYILSEIFSYQPQLVGFHRSLSDSKSVKKVMIIVFWDMKEQSLLIYLENIQGESMLPIVNCSGDWMTAAFLFFIFLRTESSSSCERS